MLSIFLYNVMNNKTLYTPSLTNHQWSKLYPSYEPSHPFHSDKGRTIQKHFHLRNVLYETFIGTSFNVQ